MFRWMLHLKGAPNKDYNVALTVRDKVYYVGGDSSINGDQIEVCIFNTVSLCWRKLPNVITGRGECPAEVPPGRSGHTAVLIENMIYIWGGYSPRTMMCCTVYRFDVDTHRWLKPRISGTVPEGRWYHSACVLGKVMYIYGGFNQLTAKYTNDMYKLDTTVMVWSLINTRGIVPPTSSFHSATIIGTKMFVFGGLKDLKVSYNTIRVFDTETNFWLITPPSAQLLPGGRSCHSAFTYNGELYILGGQGFSDLWQFSPEPFSWKKVEPKGMGLSETYWWMCCCMVGGRVILFGGLHGDTPADDLYILDLSPTLKMLCKLSVIQYDLEQGELPHDIKWELAAMKIK